jgi:uncharacterized peroxidase-related enzyme
MALIPFLEKEDVEKSVYEIYEKFEKETGKVPEWVKVMAHSPKIVKEFIELFKVIMDEGKIEPDLKWKMAYLISETLKCPFCVSVTTKMLKKFGADGKTMEDVKEMKNLSETEREILELVKDITEDGHLDRPEIFEKLKEKFNSAQIVELISVIGLFNYINRFNNTLGVLPE